MRKLDVLSLGWLNTCSELYSNLQNDILTENTHTVQIKVDPPADGNAANTLSGNDAVLLLGLLMFYGAFWFITQDLNNKKNNHKQQ